MGNIETNLIPVCCSKSIDGISPHIISGVSGQTFHRYRINTNASAVGRVAIIDGARLLFDRRVEDITQRLAFRLVEPGETVQPLYSQHVLGGNAGVFVKQAGEEETKLNLELLFNAALTAGDKLGQVFTDTKNAK